MKRFTLLLWTFLCAIAMHAENKSLFVTFNDGSKVEFAISTTPEITVADDKLTVSTTQTTLSYDLWTVRTFTYGATTGIRNAELKDIVFDGENLIVDGANAHVKAFAIDGKAVNVSPFTTGNSTVIPLSSLHKGVYIINVNGKSIKITRQ